MADTIVIDLLKQLGSLAAQQSIQEINLIVGVDEEVKKLKDNLGIIQDMLDDAEERQVKQRTEKQKHWVEQLKNAYYEIDDVLDKWDTARIKSEIEKADNAPAMNKSVCSFFPSPSFCCRLVRNLALRYDIGHKIKKLNETLNMIAKSRLNYRLDSTSQVFVVERPKTTSFVNTSEIIGRHKQRDDLLSDLLDKGHQEERNPRVISLVGMSGIGKTTLAQLTYNDPKVQLYFEKRIWVCVSEHFDQCRVAKAMCQELDLAFPNNIIELQTQLRKLSDLIRGNRFLLVLDDVWSEDSTMWEPFKPALENGAQGSKILITTCKQKVAEVMGSSLIINLRLLSHDDCWFIFSKIAFSNEDEHKSLEDLGRKLAIKCKGLPLTAKSLGSLMHKKRDLVQWKKILASNLWELESCFLAPLLLSYYELPSAMKRCFSYCSLFPKDCLFSRDELVFQWMAQGYIKSNTDMEIIGEEYFENLALRSFFQEFEKYGNDGKIIGCKMHDIVHDFAQSITTNECFQINCDKELDKDCKSARHLRLKIPIGKQSLELVYQAKNLRTLFLLSDERDYIFDELLFDLLQHFRWLRTLILDCPINKLPNAIENLIHLRCLLMSNYVQLEELPETICNLSNLQTLCIKYCYNLKKLPQGMGKLINLRHLSFIGFSCQKCPIFPKGFEKLISLRTLSDFNIGGMDEREGCRLGELKKLNHLRGTLRIYGLGNMIDVSDAEDAQLKMKIYLHSLELWFGKFDILRDTINRRIKDDVLILNALEAPSDLESLCIFYYHGTREYPNWMMSLIKLKKLCLSELPYLECLPPLGKLPSLESLKISAAYTLKNVGVEFWRIEPKNKKDNAIIFPKLNSLEFQEFPKWEEWIDIGGTREEEEDNGFVTIKIMPRLCSLKIWRCPVLKSLPDFLRTTPLKKLEVLRSPILEQHCKRGTRDDGHRISHILSIKFDSD
nr:putative disease resistance RPP13-like protein 1 [Quercus suber]